MGIGFDMFKANIGWNLADGVMESVSNAIEKKAAQAEAEKQESDADDMLRTLVFMAGNNIALDRAAKKAIASVLSEINNETISLFSIEEQIDSIYSELKTESLEDFFEDITAIYTDREQTGFMYAVAMILYMHLSDEKVALPLHVYNLSLIKKYFEIERSELAECYEMLGKKLEKDVDDVADIFEELTSEESIKKIEAENPTLICDNSTVSKVAALPEVAACDNPKEAIETYYNAAVAGTDSTFTDRFILADSNPKKVIAAVNAYAKNCKGEEILIAYDDSAFGNGKVGFLLSNKKLYVCNSFEKPNEINLTDVHSIVATPKLMNSFITVNNIKIDTTMLNGHGTEIVADFLQKAIPLAMQVEGAQ